jgi:hypothetical protein
MRRTRKELKERHFLRRVFNFSPFLHQCRDCHELNSRHSVKLAWLKSGFLHRLKPWVAGAFDVDHFPLFDLNQGWDCHKLMQKHSIKLAWLKSFFLHQLNSWMRIDFPAYFATLSSDSAHWVSVKEWFRFFFKPLFQFFTTTFESQHWFGFTVFGLMCRIVWQGNPVAEIVIVCLHHVTNGSIWKVNFLRVASLKRCYVKLSFHLLWWFFRLCSRATQMHRICPRGHRDAADSHGLVCQRRSLMSEIRVSLMRCFWMPDACQNSSVWTNVIWDISSVAVLCSDVECKYFFIVHFLSL